ncbi:MAG: GTP pyrophosphokinase [Magnetococcales bacterium]|nr:GTP pyrophosphokinase [Magnetococcales bacterium]
MAVAAHRGQCDRAGAPYILHPLRLMLQMDTDLERMVAVLHDVIEDTTLTLEQLRDEGFPATVMEAIDHLTRRTDEEYEAYIQRISPHPLACRVKLADLRDNMDTTRLAHPLTDQDWQRLQRYRQAWQVITSSDTGC